jgi:biopolymer transport protein TolQ
MVESAILAILVAQPEFHKVSVSVVDIIAHSGAVGFSVLLLLLAFSVVSWGIMTHKLKLFGQVTKETGAFREQFYRRGAQLEQLYNQAKRMKNCPMARVFLAGYIELAAQFRVSQDAAQKADDEEMLLEKLDSISRALERATAQEVTRLERSLFFLGTTGSTTPFIGLFGTVWGVMEAFASIGATGAANVAVVAPGISEALIATAAGLFAAIPAVIGYNYFVHRVKIAATDLDNFSLDMLSLIDRIYIKRSS